MNETEIKIMEKDENMKQDMEPSAPTFTYTYSAREQDEVRRIREKYVQREPDKLEQLRYLDRQVTKRGRITSLTLGCVGAMILGFGMSLVMTNLGELLGIGETFILGIIFGIVGLVLASFAYPTYRRIVKTEREKIAPEILKLTEELMEQK